MSAFEFSLLFMLAGFAVLIWIMKRDKKILKYNRKQRTDATRF
ncbi:MAG: hypothetical protein QM500_08695 [Methylococcales bacterium]